MVLFAAVGVQAYRRHILRVLGSAVAGHHVLVDLNFIRIAAQFQGPSAYLNIAALLSEGNRSLHFGSTVDKLRRHGIQRQGTDHRPKD